MQHSGLNPVELDDEALELEGLLEPLELDGLLEPLELELGFELELESLDELESESELELELELEDGLEPVGQQHQKKLINKSLFTVTRRYDWWTRCSRRARPTNNNKLFINSFVYIASCSSTITLHKV